MMRFAAAAILLLPLPALAQDARSLTVVNATGTPVNQVFVRQSGRGERAGVVGALGDLVAPRGDRDDRLGSNSLRPRGSVTLPLTGIHGCRVDLKAVMEDGRTFTEAGFDACATPRWTIGG